MISNDVETLHAKADRLLDSNQLLEALNVYDSILELDEGDAQAWLMKGSIKGQFGNVVEAEQSIKEATRLDPAYAEAHFTLANLYYTQNRLTEAKQACENAVGADPDYPEAWIMLGGIQKKEGDLEGLVSSCRQALKYSPDSVEARSNLEEALKKLGISGEVGDTFEQMSTSATSDSGDHLQLGSRYLELSQFQDALASFNELLKAQPENISGHIGAGAALISLKRFTEAEQHYNHAHSQQPDSVFVYRGLSQIFLARNDLESLLRYSEQILTCHPDLAEAHYNIGLALLKRGKLNDAEREFLKTLELDSNVYAANFWLAEMYRLNGHDDLAVEHYDRVLGIVPDHVEARHLRSIVKGEATQEKAPDEYVSALFDRFADGYDENLVGDLSYQAPEKLFSAIKKSLPDNKQKLTIADLGCGTGLMAPLLSPIKDRLIGIDLSAKMLDKARERDVYDQLIQGELVDVLRSTDMAFDLITAADVLIYIGNLGPLFEICRDKLARGGLFAFTIEKLNSEDPYQLHSSGRYAHSLPYIQELARSTGLDEVSCEDTVTRTELNNEVQGVVIVLRKP